MNTIIVITSSLLAVVGISFSIWSLIDTRKRYNEKQTKEKHRADD